MYKIYRKNNYLIIDNGVNISEKYLAKDVLVQEIIENVLYEIYGILPKLGNTSNQLLHGVSIPNILKENNSPYTATEWVDFYTVNTGFFFELTSGGSTGSIPTDQFVNSYSDLPDPTTVTYQIWVSENPEGTQWLPGSLGGTYYPEGGYVSNGVKWIYHKDSYQATQLEVDAGIISTKWVSPLTLENSSKWSTFATIASIPVRIVRRTTSFYASTSTNRVDVPNMFFDVVAEKQYKISIIGVHYSAVSTTGISIGFVLPSGTGIIYGCLTIGISNLSVATDLTKSIMAISSSNTQPYSFSTATTGVTAAPAYYSADLIFECVTSGVFQMQFGSEIESSEVNIGPSTMIVETLN